MREEEEMMTITIIPAIIEEIITRIDNDMTEETGINIILITNFEEKIISFCLETVIGRGMTIKMNKIVNFLDMICFCYKI